jgi:3-hydroxy-9,10-secoandrosta-1,3,5(10)-triene-9,17-dione monooxygenase reductase component
VTDSRLVAGPEIPDSEEIPEGPEIPEGMRPDARETWPSRELIESFLGDFDFELRPGETIHVDTEEQARAARKFRDVLGRFATGITVVTSISGGEPVGMTCQSFMSVSLDPPLVLFSPAKTSRAWPAIQRSGRFCVNFLADDQEQVSATMASRGIDKFADLRWTATPETGSPLLSGALGYVDCTIHAVHETGDHYVVIGRVQDLDVTRDGEPLLFYRGDYRTTGG